MSQLRRLVHCTLPPELARRPVLHGLAHASGAVINVHRANVDVEAGVAWYLLELEGSEAEVDRAESWLREQGVTVERIEDRPPGHGSTGHGGSATPGSPAPS
jgi:NIL domain